MITRSSWLQAKTPFTVLLLPLFWIVLLLSPNLNEWRSLWVLVITHGLLYSSVNAYVNFYSKKKSNVNTSSVWLYFAFAGHIAAIVLGAIKINYTFAAIIFLYGATAHAYGIAAPHLKEPSRLHWVLIRAFQGISASLLYYTGLNNFSLGQSLSLKVILPGIVASLILAAFFPLNKPAVDNTRKNELIQSIITLVIAAGINVWFFTTYLSPQYNAGIIIAFTFGVLLLIENQEIKKTEKEAEGYRTPWKHLAGAIALNVYAFYLFTDYTQILQLIQ